MRQVQEFRVPIGMREYWQNVASWPPLVVGSAVPIFALGKWTDVAAWGKVFAFSALFVCCITWFLLAFVSILVAPIWGIRQTPTKSFRERRALLRRMFSDDIDDTDDTQALIAYTGEQMETDGDSRNVILVTM